MRNYVFFLLILFLVVSECAYGMDGTMVSLSPKQSTLLSPTSGSNMQIAAPKHGLLDSDSIKDIAVEMCVSDLCIMPAALLDQEKKVEHLSVQQYVDGTYDSHDNCDDMFNVFLAILSHKSRHAKKKLDATSTPSNQRSGVMKSMSDNSSPIPKSGPVEFHASICIAKKSSNAGTQTTIGCSFELPAWETETYNKLPSAYQSAFTQKFTVQKLQEEANTNLLTLLESCAVELTIEKNIGQVTLVIPNKEQEQPYRINISNFNSQFFDFMLRAANAKTDLFLISKNPDQYQGFVILSIAHISTPFALLKTLPSSSLAIGNGILVCDGGNSNPYYRILYGNKTLYFKLTTLNKDKGFNIEGTDVTTGKKLKIKITAIKKTIALTCKNLMMTGGHPIIQPIFYLRNNGINSSKKI